MRVALLNGWCDKVLNKLVHAYQERTQLLVSILQTEPLIQIDTIPCGGYFVWITFTSSKDPYSSDYYVALDVLNYCRELAQVNFLVGDRCDSFTNIQHDSQGTNGNNDDDVARMMYESELPPDCCQYSARLCFADLTLEDLEEGAKRLVSAFQEYHKMKTS